MEKEFVWRNTRLDNSGKKGILKPDDQGWYTICLGALNHTSRNINSVTGQNEFYSAVGSEKFFSEGTAFQRRISGGLLKAEYGHPEKLPGMSEMDYVNRILRIDEKNVCGTFGKIWLKENYTDPLNGEKCIGIFGTILPSGPYGSVLKEDLDKAGQNVCFSIRSLINYKIINGRNCKVLKSIVTFDYVNEPGIHCAEKLLSPSIETVTEQKIMGPMEVYVSKKTAFNILKENEKRGLERNITDVLDPIINEDTSKLARRKESNLKKAFDW